VSFDDELRMSRAALAMKTGQARATAQHEKNEVKANERQRKAQLARNLKGEGPTRHAPKGSVNRLMVVWEDLMRAYFPAVVTAPWFVMEDGKRKYGKDAGLSGKLAQRYPEKIVEGYFRFAFGNWILLRPRFPKCPIVPTVGWLFIMADTLVPESQMPEPESEKHPAVEELMQWFKDHPDETSPPAELMARVPLSFKKGG